MQTVYYNDEDSFTINKFNYKFCSICSLYKICILNKELLYFISYKKCSGFIPRMFFFLLFLNNYTLQR